METPRHRSPTRSSRRKSFSRYCLLVALCLVQWTGCGTTINDTTELEGPSNDLASPTANAEDSSPIEPLQIARWEQSMPLEKISPVYPGQSLHLKVLNVPEGEVVHWSSSDTELGVFKNPGVLYLLATGDFEIHVNTETAQGSIQVEVLESEADLPPIPGNKINPAPELDPEDIPDPVPSDPFMDEVADLDLGAHSGFGMDNFPDVVLGPPQGGGGFQAGLDVLSLGVGGEITLKSDTPILNGPGADFIVFENPFWAGGNPQNPFAEPAEVSVSQDGVTFWNFICHDEDKPNGYPGCAGVHAVFANPVHPEIDPLDPEEAGGDAFDLETLGLTWVQYVRVRDLSLSGASNTAGFDLDAISIVHQ